MVKILRYLRAREWIFLSASFVFIVMQVWLDLRLPDYMSEITMLLQTPNSSVEGILLAGGYMLLCALGSMVAAMFTGFFVAQIGATLSRRLRAAMFDQTLAFSMEELSAFSTASLITRCTNDITQVQNFVTMGLQMLVKAPILAVWAVMKIAGKNWEWTVTTGLAVVILMVMIVVVLALAIPKTIKLQKMTDDLNRVTREHLTGIRVVRAYNAEDFQRERFEGANGNLTKTNLFVSHAMAFLMPGISLIMSGLSLAIYVLGAVMIEAASAPMKLVLFSDMVVFSAYAVQVIMAFMLLLVIFIMMPRAMVSAKRIMEVIETRIRIEDGATVAGEEGLVGTVEFRHVSFRYPDAEAYVLEDISFVANKGETVAIIGSTGCGKSTVINLIPRFYDVTEGEILVDGVNVKAYTQEALRNKIGYVPQKSTLFSGTIASNIGYGDNGRLQATLSEIKAAADIGQASEFIDQTEAGYESRVAQGGANFSGGQKQRLSIARAVCRDPEFYLFDDSFSALDYKTDKVLRQALREAAGEATILIVASRVGTIRHADRIIVLEDGKMVGSGTHSELIKTCAIYKEIALSQLSEEEIA